MLTRPADRQLGDSSGIEHVKVQISIDHRLLHLDGKPVPDLGSAGYGLLISTVAPGRGNLQHFDGFEEAPLMHTDEGRPVDQIGAFDRLRIEAEVADRHRSRLLQSYTK